MSETKPTPGLISADRIADIRVIAALAHDNRAASALNELLDALIAAPETAAELAEANGYAERLLKYIWPEDEYPRFKVCTDMLGKLTQLDHALGSRRVKLEETAAELARIVTALGCQLCPDHALGVIEAKNGALDEQEAELARVKAIVEILDQVLMVNHVGPRVDGDYRKALHDLIGINVLQSTHELREDKRNLLEALEFALQAIGSDRADNLLAAVLKGNAAIERAKK